MNRGRKPLPESERRNKFMVVCLNQQEFRRISLAASSRGQNLSSFIRSTVFERLKNCSNAAISSFFPKPPFACWAGKKEAWERHRIFQSFRVSTEERALISLAAAKSESTVSTLTRDILMASILATEKIKEA